MPPPAHGNTDGKSALSKEILKDEMYRGEGVFEKVYECVSWL